MAKPNTKIKRDSHGIYVRAGGYLFRPRPHSLLTHPLVTTPEQRAKVKNIMQTSAFDEGDPVRARHIGGSQFGVVGDNERGDETWASHGMYYDRQGKQISSEKIWIGNDR